MKLVPQRGWKALVLPHILHSKFFIVLIAENCLVLCAVVFKDAANIRRCSA